MLIIIAVILIIFVILEKQDEQARRLEDSGKGGYRRLSIWVSEDGKGKDRSRLTRVILDRHWGRKEANALTVQVGKLRHQGWRWLATWNPMLVSRGIISIVPGYYLQVLSLIFSTCVLKGLGLAHSFI